MGADGVPNTQRAQGLLPGVQLLRGCAAILVIIAHANAMMVYPQYFGRSPYYTPDLGVFGVAVFFVISGFIIAIVSLDRDRQPTLTVRDYARRRFIRIVPFLWLCTIGYNMFTYLGTHDIEWAAMARALVVWPVGDLKPNVIWSLRHEFLFYLLFALTMLGHRQRPALLVAWFLAPLVIWAALLPWDYRTTAWHPYNNELFRTVFLGSDTGANLQLGAGFLLGLAWLHGSRWMTAWLPAGLLISAALAVGGAVIITVIPLDVGFARTMLWTALASVIVGAGIVARAAPAAMAQPGLVLGNASFSIYLVHNPTLLILLELTKRHVALLSPTAFLILFVVLAIGAGIAVHYLVEKPLIAVLSGRHPFFLKGKRAKATGG